MRMSALFSIRTKFAILAAMIVAVFAVLWGSQTVHEEQEHLFHKLESNGRMLLSSLRAPVINTMILQEMGMVPGVLDNYVEEIIKSPDFPAVYAFIVDDSGRVLAHNRSENYNMFFNDPLTRAALVGDGFRSAIVDDGLGSILDMALPLRVAGKSWGALRVGFSMNLMEAEYLAFRMRIMKFSALIFLVGTAIFYMVGYTLSHPLKKLTQAMSNVDLGAFEINPPAPRRDEVGLLQKSFHDMLVRLRRSEQERQNALNYVIQNEKMATIGKIVAGVAHEVNNPLAAISACIYNMETNSSKDPRTCMDILKAGIDRIATIVHQLSDFSRVGTLDLQYVPSDLFFREAEAFAAMALKNLDVRLFAQDECQPPAVLHIDKGKLHQVVLNLLINAVDASPDEGTIELHARKQDGSYVLTVRDYGMGIPPEDQERIFDIFFTTKSAGEGSGIGLAVCKSIVDIHRGVITIDSRPGETTFTVTIPLENGVDHE